MKCVFCGRALPVGAPVGICDICAPQIPYYTGEYLFESGRAGGAEMCDRIICALNYTGFVRRAVSGFKFRGRRDFGMTLAAVLCERLRHCESQRSNPGPAPPYDLAACVPLSGARLRERGYNQAAVLAKYTARYLDIPFEAGLLIRDSSALRQSELRRAERLKNVRTAFRVDPATALAASVAGAHILLIDDVATSMATINACAAVLKANGVSAVTGAVLASPLF